MNQFLVTEADRQDMTRQTEDPESRIVYASADIGRHFGAERIALHHLGIEPGFRTSLPHAESHEEEFVLVLKGAPSVFIDGHLYAMEEGDFVGFPSGGGSNHSIVNNSGARCELLVAGERTKPENKCAFALNPEMETLNPWIWWQQPPAVKLGSDSPLPEVGNVGNTLISTRPENLKNWRFIREFLPFSYPTCDRKETFSLGRDLTAAGTLSRIGMYVDRLAPGKRSSWPHAHKFEDELLFVMEGQVKVWVNGEVLAAKSGDFIGFKSGRGDVHTIINDSADDAFLFVLGERHQDYQDLIYYSHHPKQNERNKGRDQFWADRPDVPMGSVNPEPGAAG